MKAHKNYILAAFAILLLAACGKDLSYDTLHERVIGTWITEEVTFRQEGSVCKKDVTTNWDQYKFLFHEDESFQLANHESGEVFEGYWYINEYWKYDNNNEGTKVQELIIVVYDENYENTREFLWTNVGATNSSLQAKEKENNGVYRFKLKK